MHGQNSDVERVAEGDLDNVHLARLPESVDAPGGLHGRLRVNCWLEQVHSVGSRQGDADGSDAQCCEEDLQAASPSRAVLEYKYKYKAYKYKYSGCLAQSCCLNKYSCGRATVAVIEHRYKYKFKYKYSRGRATVAAAAVMGHQGYHYYCHCRYCYHYQSPEKRG